MEHCGFIHKIKQMEVPLPTVTQSVTRDAKVLKSSDLNTGGVENSNALPLQG